MLGSKDQGAGVDGALCHLLRDDECMQSVGGET
jgi:hypothetical protein